MAELNNCILPDDLYFNVQDNIWVKDMGDETVRLGMSDIAQSMAGNIIHCRPKKAGSKLKAGRSVATVESGKWVGPVRCPFGGSIVAINEQVEADAALINRSPYKEGWIIQIKPDDFAGALAGLVQGQAALDGFKAYMEEHEITGCTHCEGFEG